MRGLSPIGGVVKIDASGRGQRAAAPAMVDARATNPSLEAWVFARAVNARAGPVLASSHEVFVVMLLHDHAARVHRGAVSMDLREILKRSGAAHVVRVAADGWIEASPRVSTIAPDEILRIKTASEGVGQELGLGAPVSLALADSAQAFFSFAAADAIVALVEPALERDALASRADQLGALIERVR